MGRLVVWLGHKKGMQLDGGDLMLLFTGPTHGLLCDADPWFRRRNLLRYVLQTICWHD